MGTGNGGVMMDLPASGRSQVSRRPPRACTARTPSRLAPPAPSVERTPSRKQQPRSHQQTTDPPFTPMVLTSPPSPAQKDRWLLRSMWELASTIHFLNVFRPILNIKVEFSIEELEDALLVPNALLDDIHIALLKAIPPISRSLLNRDTWVVVLCKKMKDRWRRVAEGIFPLAPYHGEEKATYKELDPDVRVVILKALCEARLELDDIRAFIDDMSKQGMSNIRKEKTGSDMQGTTYWYENDPVAGQRLYRELRRSDNKDKPKIRGRLVLPPSAGQWETLATNLDEFLTVADKLSSSKNRLEVAVGKRINNDIIPDLQDFQKRKDRALKKQQRQALLLDSYFNTEVLTAGRPKRDRKPVTYTFDDYDKSISEAIKITKRRNASPESPVAGDDNLSNGYVRQHSDDDEVDLNGSEDKQVTEESSPSKNFETRSLTKPIEQTTHSSESESSGSKQFGRGRRLRRPQRYAESDFVDPMSENEADVSSEEDIEGEAVYDDDYVSKKKRRLGAGSDGDDEYRGDEEEEEEEEEEDDVDDEEDDDEDEDEYMGSSDEGEYPWRKRMPRNTGGRTRAKAKAAEKSQTGLRRSQRATRSHVDYRKYEESDMEGEEDMRDTASPDRSDHDKAMPSLANGLENVRETDALERAYTTVGGTWDKMDVVEQGYDTKDLHTEEAARRTSNGIFYESQADVKPEVKVHRFLDLNVAAPMGGGQDDGLTAYSNKVQNHPPLFTVEKFEHSGDDGSTCDSPKASNDWRRR